VNTLFYAMSKGKVSEQKRSEILQGTLDLMILKTLDAMGRFTITALRAGSSN